MNEFVSKYCVSIILGFIGVLYIVFNISAVFASKKEGRFISGIPFMGGVHIFLAFLLTPLKWLCFLCLLDYTIPMFLFTFIPEMIDYQKVQRRFKRVFSKYKYKGEYEQKNIEFKFGENESFEMRLLYRYVYAFTDCAALLAICKNKGEPRVLAIIKDKNADNEPVLIPFEGDSASADDIVFKGERLTLTVKVKNE